MIGALQCLTMTRPDIIYAIHTVFQVYILFVLLIYTLSSIFSGIYRVLWILACSFVLHLLHQPSLSILMLDSANCEDSCHSTAGYAVFFGSNPSPGASRSGLQFSNLPLKLSTRLLLTALLKLFEFASYLMIWVPVFPILPRSTVGILVLLIWQ